MVGVIVLQAVHLLLHHLLLQIYLLLILSILLGGHVFGVHAADQVCSLVGLVLREFLAAAVAWTVGVRFGRRNAGSVFVEVQSGVFVNSFVVVLFAGRTAYAAAHADDDEPPDPGIRDRAGVVVETFVLVIEAAFGYVAGVVSAAAGGALGVSVAAGAHGAEKILNDRD